MRVKTKLKYLGFELKQGVKDPNKYYKIVTFLDNVQSVNILTDDVLFSDIQSFEQLTECECELELTLGKYTKCKLLSCHSLQNNEKK